MVSVWSFVFAFSYDNFQAFVRGWLSRKKLLESHKEFQLIVKDIEGPDVVAQWPTYFSSFPDLVHSSHELTQSKMKHINDAKRIFNDNPEQPVLFHSSLNTVEVLQPTKNVEHDHRSSGSFIQNTNLRKGNDDHSLASIVTLPEECGAFELRYSAPVKLDGDRYSSEKPGTEFCGAGSSASMTTVSIAVSHRSNGKDSGADQPSSNPASLECNSLDKSFSSCMPVKDDLTNCHSDGLAGNVAEADGNKGMSALTSFSADQTSLWDDGLDETQEVICHSELLFLALINVLLNDND